MPVKKPKEEPKNKASGRDLSLAIGGITSHYPFLSPLVFALEYKFNEEIPTLCTNGKWVKINPEFFGSSDMRNRVSELLHEFGHVMMLHFARTEAIKRSDTTFNSSAWEMAEELEIHESLFPSFNIAVPDVGVKDSKYRGWNAEQIYADLKKTVKEQKLILHVVGGNGDSNGDSNGDKKDGQGQSNTQDVIDKIKTINQAIIQQYQYTAKQKGWGSGFFVDFVTELYKPQVNWQALLQQLAQEFIYADYGNTWDRKKIFRGQYEPAFQVETVTLGLAIDTSGSQSDEDIRRSLSEIKGVLSTVAGKLYILLCDSEVTEVKEIDIRQFDDFVNEIHVSRGGTDFKPVFYKIAEENLPIRALLYFTDGDGDFPETAPDYPVVWISNRNKKEHYPFGAVVEYDIPDYVEGE